MMKYRTDGHRDKQASWNFDFIHATLRRHRDPVTGETTDEPPYPYPHLFDPDKQEEYVESTPTPLYDSEFDETDEFEEVKEPPIGE